MKKRISLLLVMIFVLIMPMTCYAAGNAGEATLSSGKVVLLGSGYTEDGIYYEVYGEPVSGNPGSRANLYVERSVTFVGEVYPPETLDWQEVINGVEWVGYLTLDYFYYVRSTNRTTAHYYGTLTNN